MLGVLLLTSCLEDENEQGFQKINPEIEAAKGWYESFENEYQSVENARQSSKAKGKPAWSQSKIYRQADGKKVIEVRFDFEQIDIPSHLKTEALSRNSVLQTLLLYPKENGTYIPYFLIIYPDNPNFQFEQEDFHRGAYQSIPKDFSGVYRFYRWNGNFIGGWRIQEGIKTHRIRNQSEVLGTGNQLKISNYTVKCYLEVTTWYQYSCFGDQCTPAIEIGEDITGIECELEFQSITPPDDSGEGGPGGYSDFCEQPEGNILDMPVECEEEEMDPEDECELDEAELVQIFPNVNSLVLETLKDLINTYGADFGLIEKEVIAHFISQAGHETNGFSNTGFTENLYYTTAERLLKIFPSKFSLTDPNKKNPNDYLRNPQKLANLVYAWRNGNGSESSGDGYKYRGRGAFQLTGKDNYSDFNNFYQSNINTENDFVSNPDLIASDQNVGILSAMWFFKDRVLDKISDISQLTVDNVTQKINGPFKAGLDDRKNWFEIAINMITC